MADDTELSEADPCVVCGTTGGYVNPGEKTPVRCRGACSVCYSRLYRRDRLNELDRQLFNGHAFIERLLAGDVEPDESGCILWPGTLAGGGYARVRIGGVDEMVSHLVLEAFAGPPPSADHVAAHAPHEVCGNRSCVNVDHLRWATEVENAADRAIDDTEARGERNGLAKLTEEEVLEIRAIYAKGGWSHRQLAARYGVGHTTIGMITRKKTWTHLEDLDAEGAA